MTNGKVSLRKKKIKADQIIHGYQKKFVCRQRKGANDINDIENNRRKFCGTETFECKVLRY